MTVLGTTGNIISTTDVLIGMIVMTVLYVMFWCSKDRIVHNVERNEVGRDE